MSSVIGIDLGGTKIAAARYDAKTWNVQADARYDTPKGKEFIAVFQAIVDAIMALRTEDTEAVGVGVPGLIRQPEGSIVTLPNIPRAEGFSLREKLASALKLAVSVGNDANCFALAEALHGVGKGRDIVVGITMGTGVGGGIVVNGKLLQGSHGFANEIGHMLLKPGEPPYPTEDKRGDVEQFLSGTAMGKRCEAAKRPEDYLKGEVCAFLQPEVLRETAWMCASLAHLIDPSMIIFGGSTGRALAPHLSAIQKELPQWMLPGIPPPDLAIAQLTNAATLGAALLTQE
ncbi:hypothetical protein COU80_05430 [Candidatus Peregrinibacteria bacterium CG10_big_fil_rev_8_21_14_0_10_55_24]|nr:MAG: hypothetical protein COU80_05430 [Candidatus Peregrinibacteria bacterium CG10_big_fil_rev_8_21_14_0_10_55_24]